MNTCLKYVTTPAKLCSHDLLVLCRWDKLLLSQVFPAPAHNSDIFDSARRHLVIGETGSGLVWVKQPQSAQTSALCREVAKQRRVDYFKICATCLIAQTRQSRPASLSCPPGVISLFRHCLALHIAKGHIQCRSLVRLNTVTLLSEGVRAPLSTHYALLAPAHGNACSRAERILRNCVSDLSIAMLKYSSEKHHQRLWCSKHVYVA